MDILSNALGILLFSALPVVELRGAIPFGVLTTDIPIFLIYCIAVVGNMIPVMFLLLLLPLVEKTCRKYSKTLDRLFTWWFKRVVDKNQKTFERWGVLALVILVAIPLPMTGAWTGSAAAYLFKIDKLKSFFYITIGVIIAGGIVTLLTITGTTLF